MRCSPRARRRRSRLSGCVQGARAGQKKTGDLGARSCKARAGRRHRSIILPLIREQVVHIRERHKAWGIGGLKRRCLVAGWWLKTSPFGPRSCLALSLTGLRRVSDTHPAGGLGRQGMEVLDASRVATAGHAGTGVARGRLDDGSISSADAPAASYFGA